MDEIGSICEYEGCSIRDFLPITCDRCGKKFCHEHQNYKEHECPIVVEDHPIIKCRKTRYKCKFKGCKRYNKVEIKCLYCHKNFCAGHISYDNHGCKNKIFKPIT